MEEHDYLELREWSPLIDLFEKIPTRTKSLINLGEIINISCFHVVEEFIALGTNVGLIYWYNREKKDLKEFRCDSSPITCIRIVSTVEYLIAAGDRNGNVFVYQLQKELSQELLYLGSNLHQKQNEKYSVRGTHKSPIKSLEWSKNGMKLFSGDQMGLVVLTEFDFLKHESRSSEILNEAYEIVQLSFAQKRLLASSIFRTVICEPSAIPGEPWRICQVGKKDRKLLSICGATIFSNTNDRKAMMVCVRPGGRIWLADAEGNVDKTMVFKDIFEARRPDVFLINPSRKLMKISNEFELIHPFMKDYCVTFNKDAVFVLNLKKNRVEATVKYLRGVYDVAVNNEEIFVLEGPRTIIRIAPNPDPYSEVRSSVFMNRSSLANGFDPSVCLEYRAEDLTGASECQELPPIEHLDVQKLLQESFPGPTSDEHLKKLEVFNEINDESFDTKILFKSRRLKVQEALSPSDMGAGKGIVEIAQLAKADDDLLEQQNGSREFAVTPLQMDSIVVENEDRRPSNLLESLPINSKSSPKDNYLPGSSSDNVFIPDPPESPSITHPDPTEANNILNEILNYTSANFSLEEDLERLLGNEKSSFEKEKISREILESAFLGEVTDIPNMEIELMGSESSRSTSRQTSAESLLGSDWEIIELNK